MNDKPENESSYIGIKIWDWILPYFTTETLLDVTSEVDVD